MLRIPYEYGILGWPDRCNRCDVQWWKEVPQLGRPGWLTVSCEWCGKWIGYRPIKVTRNTRKQAKSSKRRGKEVTKWWYGRAA